MKPLSFVSLLYSNTAAAKLLQSCPTLRPHRLQPIRLCHPWDSPGKNTGMGCHFLLQCIKVKSESEIVQSCPTLSDPMDCSLAGSSIHGIFQARMMGWVTISYSRGIFLTQGLHSCLWHLMHWQIDPLRTPPPCRPPWSGTNVGTFQEGNK